MVLLYGSDVIEFIGTRNQKHSHRSNFEKLNRPKLTILPGFRLMIRLGRTLYKSGDLITKTLANTFCGRSGIFNRVVENTGDDDGVRAIVTDENLRNRQRMNYIRQFRSCTKLPSVRFDCKFNGSKDAARFIAHIAISYSLSVVLG